MPPRNDACRDFLLGILIFKGLTVQRLDAPFGVKGLKQLTEKLCLYRYPTQVATDAFFFILRRRNKENSQSTRKNAHRKVETM
jgi:hypothetical protein